MNDLENLSVEELRENLNEESSFETKKNILKTITSKEQNYIENSMKWGNFIETEKHDGLQIGEKVEYKSLFGGNETGYIAGFLEDQITSRVRTIMVPDHGYGYSTNLKGTIRKRE